MAMRVAFDGLQLVRKSIEEAYIFVTYSRVGRIAREGTFHKFIFC